MHLRNSFVSVNLSKELRRKEGKRNLPVKKGDKVKIVRGKFKGKQGKVLEVRLKISKVIVENINVTKQDGSKANVKFQPSNLQIIEMAERVKKKAKQEKSKKETKEDSDKKPKKQEDKK